MIRKRYVTTSIPYVNARPHVGHALELVQADVIARFHRLIGTETWFQTGTDENAFKNVLAARREGISTRQLVDRNSSAFRHLCAALNVTADSFIRTTEERHRAGVIEFWKRLKPQDVYRSEYEGLYCVGCEDFFLERDLVDGRCPEHGAAPTKVKEKNYFFRLSAYGSQIEALLRDDRIKVVPLERKNEVLSFVERGLRDISISRDAARAGGWGIPVPGDPSQVIYVWIDALMNYVTGLGFGDGSRWRRFWGADTVKTHVIGKNVWKFHAVYWPAMLLSAGLPLPDEILVHGFLTVDGAKISKSLGNAVDPLPCIERYGADAVRCYLLRAVPAFGDGDFSVKRLRQLYDSDLANGLGNLVSRLTALGEKGRYGRFHCQSRPPAPEGYVRALRSYRFDKALRTVWTLIERLNKRIEEAKPWKLLRAGDGESLRRHLTAWLVELRRIAHWLQPLLPDCARTVLDLLAEGAVKAAPPLFPRAR